MAVALLRHQLDVRGVEADVASAGERSGGAPASPGAVQAMAGRGLDLSGHRSTKLTDDAVDSADLVLAMARRHLRAVVLLRSDALERTFTLKEIVRRAGRTQVRQPGEPLDGWLRRLNVGRSRRSLLGDDPLDDVADPIGGPQSGYERAAVEIDHLVERLVGLGFGAATPHLVASAGGEGDVPVRSR